MVVAWLPRSPVRVSGGGREHGDHGLAVLFFALLAAAFVVYLAGIALVRSGVPFVGVFAVACAIQLAPLAAPLLASTDAWTYWSYARVHDPYRDPPREDAVSAPYVGASYLDETSLYGPAFSLAAKPVELTSSATVAAWAFKTLAGLCVLLATWLVARRRSFAAALVGWNPLVAVHFAGGGHNDALMVALLAVALALGDRGRRHGAGAGWALAVLVKWVPVVLLPLRALEARARGRRVDHVAFAATMVVTLALATVLWRLHWLDAIGPLARNASRETKYAVPHRLGLPWWPFAAAYAVAYAWLLREAARGRARLGLALALLLPALPYLIAWYVLWPLATSAYDDDDTATMITLALCAYLLPQAIL